MNLICPGTFTDQPASGRSNCIRRFPRRRLVIIFVFSAFFSLVTTICESSEVNVQVDGAHIRIHAVQTPLIEVIREAAQKTGISVKTSARLDNPVSVDIGADSVEQAMHRLLSGNNYAVFYDNTGDRRTISEIWVFGGKSPASGAGTSSSGQFQTGPEGQTDEPPAPDDHRKRFAKTWFRDHVRDTDSLSKQIFADPSFPALEPSGNRGDLTSDLPPADTEQGPPPGLGNLRVSGVSKGSIFEKMGIREGDLIRDVNGVTVQTESDFVKALNTDMPLIRIERIDTSGRIDPIYIELE